MSNPRSNNKGLTPAERDVARYLDRDRRLRAQFRTRPKIRGDCADGPRPCPWAACRFHLYVHITKLGSLSLPYPDQEPWEIEHTCALDLAAERPHTLEEVGAVTGLTRERVRQIEEATLDKIGGALDGHHD